MKERILAARTIPERRPAATLCAVGILFCLLYGSSLVLLPKPDGRIVLGDATHHYVQLRSAVFDGDLHFRNEYVALYRLEGDEAGVDWVYDDTRTGHVRNLMPVGPAILWAPAFVLVTCAVWIASLFGSGYPLDGYGRVFQATAGFSGIIAATIGAWFSYRAATIVAGSRAAIWATLTIWLSSSAIYYSLISPTYSHAASIFAVSAFWVVWIRTRDDQRPTRYAVLGLLVGAAALMRWQDAILMSVPVFEIVWRTAMRQRLPAVGSLAALGAGVAIGFLPQALVWWVLYGTPFTIPQGPGFMRWADPALGAVLFSDNHGLFSWTPVVAVAVAGLLAVLRRDVLIGGAAIVFFAMSWYVNAAVADWWAGEAFGARRFVSCFPVFVVGLAALFERVRNTTAWGAAVCAAFGIHTCLLLVQYQTFMRGLRDVAPYPAGFDGLFLARFRVPFDLLHRWLN